MGARTEEEQEMQEIIKACEALEKAGVFDIIGLAKADKGEVYVSLTDVSLEDIKNALEDKTISDEDAIAKVICNKCGIYPEVKFHGASTIARLNMSVTYKGYIITKKTC